jgi:hypothetical protein
MLLKLPDGQFFYCVLVQICCFLPRSIQEWRIAISFFAVAALLFFTDRWYRKSTYFDAFFMGLSMGLIFIIRSQDALLACIPILWALPSFSLSALQSRLKLWIAHFKHLVLAMIGGLVCVIPQLCYLKNMSGKWFYYTYVGETFNFKSPRILGGLINGSNGWFLYSPLMFLVVVFLVFGANKHTWKWLILAILSVYVYVVYSWWCWNYINGLGSRPMVDMYPILSLPLAYGIQKIGSSRVFFKILGIAFIALSTFLSLKFTWQQYHGHIFSENHNSAFYKAMLPKFKPDREALKSFFANRLQPSANELSFEKTLFQADFQSKQNNPAFVQLEKESAVSMRAEHITLGEISGEKFNLKKGDWIKVKLRAYAYAEGRIWDAFSTGLLILNHKTEDKSGTIWLPFRPTNLIGNPENSIWNPGEVNQWDEIEYFTKLKQDFGIGSQLEIISFNPAHQNWILNHLVIEHWK